jgi:hypothetical protein
MKLHNLLLTAALAFSATPVFAAFTYEVIRTGYDQYNPPGQNQDSFYKIQVTGGTGDIYISDWIDNIGDSHQEDSLTEKGIQHIGYYYIDSKDQSKIQTSNIMAVGTDIKPIEVESMKSPWNDNVIKRYAYKLGTFTEGDVIEIYMDDVNGSVRSNTTKYMGAYGEGVPVVDQLVFYQNNYNWDLTRSLMPLAALDTGNGHRVFFGIYGSASEGGGKEVIGQPLPAPIVTLLIALGFGAALMIYRNRKQAKA